MVPYSNVRSSSRFILRLVSALGCRKKLAYCQSSGIRQEFRKEFTTRCSKMSSAPASDSTTRFSSRVSDYISSRPGYPDEVVELLSSQFEVPQNGTIVDIGSGTGISTEALLKKFKGQGVKVIGVEPNKEMREASDRLLASYKHDGVFSTTNGTAEDTSLKENSADLIVAAQAFHWFDVPRARQECKRILKSNGKSGVALIWNERRGLESKVTDDTSFSAPTTPVMSAYDLLLVQRANDYEKVSHHKTVDEASLNAFFGPKGFKLATYHNPYRLDFAQLKGRLLSSSYTPQEGEKGYDVMMQELQELFDKYKRDGKIDFVYNTRVFYGAMS